MRYRIEYADGRYCNFVNGRVRKIHPCFLVTT